MHVEYSNVSISRNNNKYMDFEYLTEMDFLPNKICKKFFFWMILAKGFPPSFPPISLFQKSV